MWSKEKVRAHYVGGARDRQRAKGLGGGAKERDGVWKEAIMQNTSTTINLCSSRSAAAVTLQSSSVLQLCPPGAVATFPQILLQIATSAHPKSSVLQTSACLGSSKPNIALESQSHCAACVWSRDFTGDLSGGSQGSAVITQLPA